MQQTKATIYLGRNIGERVDAVNVAQATEVVAARLSGFTRTEGLGFWHGKPENSLAFSAIVLATAAERENVLAIARTLRTMFSQEAVLVEFATVDVEFV